ncbi:MAG: peptidylprolyl isomerase [Candidatus Aenigmarchaeota archaeon]|nr:peptidylprolyl isomerase [Candidatus Aenigmarchaeota archaeon]
MPIKKGDFVEIDFVARLKDEKLVFDTTIADVAKKEGVFSENMSYGPVVVCVGQQMVLKGLDETLENKELGKFSIELSPEKAFGKKDARLLQLIPRQKFVEQKINPVVGLQVNIDDVVGIIRSVTGGRVIVDFNHPFSGKTVVYDVDVKRLVSDTKEKLTALIKLLLKQKEPNITVDGKTAIVILPFEVPKQVQDELSKQWSALVGLEKISFMAKDTNN